MPASPKPTPRIIDKAAIAAARLPFCCQCGQRTFEPGSGVHELRWSHVHHVIPRSRGGGDVAENLASLCSACHGRIHQGTLEFNRKYTLETPPVWFVYRRDESAA
jgi:5-methylcytosine-specific restriction endonuclease McrA